MSGNAAGDPWTIEAADVAVKRLEMAFGSYVGVGQSLVGVFLLVGNGLELAAAPDAWSVGCLVLEKVSGLA